MVAVFSPGYERRVWRSGLSLVLAAMCARTRPPSNAGVVEAPPQHEASRRQGSRQTLRAVVVVLTGVCAVAILFPVIGAPVHGDDRYWYLMIGSRAHGSVLEVLQWSWAQIPEEVRSGRLAPLGALERRIVGMAVIEAAVATGTPLVVYQALVKLTLFVGGVLSAVAFTRSLRWRTPGGGLVRAGNRTLWLVTIAGTLAIAAGAQAQSQFRNGWTSYAVLTYGAVIFIFGSIALLLFLTRLVADKPTAATRIVAATSLVLLAVATNASYELVYPVIPVAAVALLIMPVTDRARRSPGRKAKLLSGLAYFGGFTAVFVAVRLYLADICSRTECYEGVQPRLSIDAARTALFNLLTAIPGAGDNEVLADLERVGWSDRYPVPPSAWSVTIGLGVVVALSLSWWKSCRGEADAVDDEDALTTTEDRRAMASMLSVAACLCLFVGLGTAAIMGLSVQAQEIITEPGTPYRNTMVTWTALAFGLVLAVRALSLLLPQRSGAIVWVALAVVVGIVAALILPGNLMTLRAYRVHPGLAVTEKINWEVVLGDTTPGSDMRRCALFRQLEATMANEWTRERIYEHANSAFMHYHGKAFCSDQIYPQAAGG
jgi:hypothetical protein